MTVLGPAQAWRAGWRTFRAQTDAVLFPLLGAAVAWAAAEFVVQALISATITRSHACVRYVAGMPDPTRCGAGDHTLQVSLVVGVFAFFLLGQLFWAVVVHRALAAIGVTVRTRPLTILGTAALAAAGLTLGVGLCLLPGIVLAILGQFAVVAVLADGLDPFTAFGRSALLVVRAPVAVLGFTGLAVLTLTAGLLLGLVGVFPAIAVVALAQVHFHRSRAVDPQRGPWVLSQSSGPSS